MPLEEKTQDRILKLFEHKICSSCGCQAERILDAKVLCQKCYLIRKLHSQKSDKVTMFHATSDVPEEHEEIRLLSLKSPPMY